MGYTVGATDQAVSTERFLDAFTVTADLLLELRQSRIQESYKKETTFLTGSVNRPELSGVDWTLRVSQQSELLHQADVHEKTTKTVCDELSRWQFQPLEASSLDSSLDQLEYVAICAAEKLTRHWHSNEAVCLSERATTISRIFCGLTVLAVALTGGPAIQSDFDRLYAAAIATFGATLVKDGSAAIFEETRQLS